MENLTNHIGKIVLSLDNATRLGYILDLSFDESIASFLGYVVVDEESENEFFLPVGEVKAIGDCIFVTDETSFESQVFDTNNPYGKQVYSTDGTDLGRVCGLKFIGKKIDKIITEKCEIKQKFILCQSKNAIIFAKNKKNNKKNKKIKQKLINIPKIEIMAMQNISEQNVLPPKVSLIPSMIVNKRATQDILGLNQELIVKKDEIITQKLIEKAKRHNKLNYLIFNCK